MQYKSQPPEEGLVDVVNEIGSQNDDARKPLYVVKKYTYIDIGIPVCGRTDRERGREGGREGQEDGRMR